MRILFLIARQFNQMYQIRICRSRSMTVVRCEEAGLAPFIAKRRASRKHQNFEGHSEQAVERDCVETEAAVKSGRLGDRLGVELLIVKYSS